MKPNLSQLSRDIRRVVSKRSPEILTGLGIAGMLTTTILAVKATPKALELIEAESGIDPETGEAYEPTTRYKIELCWKLYIPAAVTGAVSTACLIGACSVNTRRNAALAAAYTLSDNALREYKSKVLETVGEKKEQIIKDKVAEKQVKDNPVSKNEVIITEKGQSLCFDSLSGRYFKSDIDKIKKVQNDLNAEILSSMCGYVSLNDFYDELNLSHTEIGDTLGWNLDNRIDIYFSAIVAEDGTPCIVIGHNNAPKYGYY